MPIRVGTETHACAFGVEVFLLCCGQKIPTGTTVLVLYTTSVSFTSSLCALGTLREATKYVQDYVRYVLPYYLFMHEDDAATSEDAPSSSKWDCVWDGIELVLCITLRTRPERRAAVEEQFASVGLATKVIFLEQDPDKEDGKRGCFHAHQHAARYALEHHAAHVLIFEDDVEFLHHFTPHTARRILRFIRSATHDWDILFLGHFPRKMELTAEPDIVRAHSMDAHAYVLSAQAALELCRLEYRGDQVDVHFHYQSARAYALYPMVAVQRATFSDTERLQRADDWNGDKLAREEALYRGCIARNFESRVHALLGAGMGIHGQ